ncbi:hypothetical protein [Calycomorphotria hydatis]|uniref:Uncharacterized protein n=1 Tax=Calycomorphotria hydatis TaxID=2528027 RepID=A0A517TCR8_9PLAN|nr:hypothetical protein [Calycomorphotria hydatis]QDT66161.1 hypothetical protein V22_34260 [Calycomorphotria hydatis]
MARRTKQDRSQQDSDADSTADENDSNNSKSRKPARKRGSSRTRARNSSGSNKDTSPDDDAPSRVSLIKPGLLLLLACLIWFAPLIVVRTGLRDQLFRYWSPQLAERVKIRHMSASWLSGVTADGVRVLGDNGEELIAIERGQLHKPLWQLLLDQSDLGEIALTNPRVETEVLDGTTTLEQALGLNEPTGRVTIPAASLLVEDGDVQITSGTGTRRLELKNLNLACSWPRGTFEPTSLKVSSLVSDGEQQGSLRLQLAERHSKPQQGTAEEPAASPSPAAGFFVASKEVPLAALSPLLERMGLDATVTGTLSCETHTKQLVNESNPRDTALTTEGRLEVRRFVLRGKPLAEGDRLSLARGTLSGRMLTTPGRIVLQDVDLQSDLARGKLDGTYELPELQPNELLRNLVRALFQQNVELEATLDLARISEAFRHSLNLREELDSGRAEFSFQSGEYADGRRWALKTSVSDIIGANGSRWNQPLSLTATAKLSAGSVDVENVSCRSTFLRVDGSGNTSDASMTVACDLNQLRSELSRFIDWYEHDFAGVVNAKLKLQRDIHTDRLLATATGNTRNLSLTWGNARYTEPQLEFNVRAGGQLQGTKVELVEKLRCEIEAGEDYLLAELLEPIALHSPQRSQAYHLDLKGDLQRWLTRARPWVDLNGINGAGYVDTTADVRINSEELTVTNLLGTGSQFRVNTPHVRIQDNRAKWEGSARWDRREQTLTSPEAIWMSNSLSLRMKQFRWQSLPGRESMAGSFLFRGDVGRVAQWLWTQQRRPSHWMWGTTEGRIDLATDDTGTRAEYKLQVDKPVITQLAQTASTSPGSPWKVLWRGDEAKLSGACRYVPFADAFELQQLALETSRGKLDASGRIDRLTSAAVANIAGNLDLDLAELNPLLSSTLGGPVELTGTSTRPFRIQGPLIDPAGKAVSEQLEIVGGLQWEGGNIYSLPAGPGTLDASLKDGLGTVMPFDLALGNGQVHAAGSVDFRQPQPVFTLPSGRLIENLTLSQQTTDQWLRYATPLLAGATESEGTFSLDVARCALPIDAPMHGEAAGTLHMHGGHVAPGGLLRMLTGTVQQISSLISHGSITADQFGQITIPAQQVQLTMSQGRIAHDKFAVQVGDAMTITTSGNVSASGQLDLIAKVPVLERWVGNDPISKKLAGTTLSIPIRGTLDQPMIDPGFLPNLAREFATQKIQDTIEEGVGGAINKLLDGALKALPGQN